MRAVWRGSSLGGSLARQVLTAWDYAWRVIAENRLFLPIHGSGAADPVRFTAMHQAGYDYLVALRRQSAHEDCEPRDLKSVFDRAFVSASGSAIEFGADTYPESKRIAALGNAATPLEIDDLFPGRSKGDDAMRALGAIERKHSIIIVVMRLPSLMRTRAWANFQKDSPAGSVCL